MKKVLGGDIGGTHTRLAVFRVGSPAGASGPEEGASGKGGGASRKGEGVYGNNRGLSLEIEAMEIFESRSFPRLEDLLADFGRRHLKDTPPAGACLGVAGPIEGQQADLLNLGWKVDGALVGKGLGLPRVLLLNDLEANAFGIDLLPESDFRLLNPGAAGKEGGRGHGCLLSAGTGLGQAGLFRAEDGGFSPMASEGGHANFAPRNEQEVRLWRFLSDKHGHVSWERVLSGPGLENIFEFLAQDGDRTSGKEKEARTRPETRLEAKRISEAGMKGEDPMAAAALEIFVSLYGAAAGNLALTFLASGGVFLGGGIAPKILPKLESSLFLEAFFNKGRLRPWLERMPVKVILNDKAALLGAGRVAAEAAAGALPRLS